MPPLRHSSRLTQRKRWWFRSPRAWVMLVLLAVLLCVIALLLSPARTPAGVMVEISTDATGIHHLDGKPVTIAALETKLLALRTGDTQVFVAILPDGQRQLRPVWPSPEIEGLLGRLKISWMSQPEAEISGVPPSDVAGGDHGR